MLELLIVVILAVLPNRGTFGERWRGSVGRALPRGFAVGGIGFVLGLLWGIGRERRRRSAA